MTPERQLEIAKKLLIHRMMNSEDKLANFNRDLGNIAKSIDEKTDTMREFVLEAMLPEVLGNMLGANHVSITIGNIAE